MGILLLVNEGRGLGPEVDAGVHFQHSKERRQDGAGRHSPAIVDKAKR